MASLIGEDNIIWGTDYPHPDCLWPESGVATYQQDQFIGEMASLIGEDNIIWGTDYPHPDCLWPESRQFIQDNLGDLAERTRRKIICDNAVRLYNLS